MPFEIFFNVQPNIGTKKEFLVVDEHGKEVPVGAEGPSLPVPVAAEVSPDPQEEEDDVEDVEESDSESDIVSDIQQKRARLNENKKKTPT